MVREPDQGVRRRRGRLPHWRKWVRFGGEIRFGCFGLRGRIGFVRYFLPIGFLLEFRAQGAETLEFLDGAAIVALGLGLVAQKEGKGMRLLGHTTEALGYGEIVFLAESDFAPAQAGHLLVHGVDGLAVGSEGLVEAIGEEAGFEAGGAEEGQLAEGDAFDGPELLGVGGVVEVDGVLAEADDFVEVFQMGDGIDGAGEAVFAGVLSGLSFAGGGAGAGGFLCVEAVGGDLFVGGHGSAFRRSGWGERE